MTGTGADNLWTKPTTTGSTTAISGITVTSTAGTFTQSNTSETLSLTFTGKQLNAGDRGHRPGDQQRDR